MGREIVLFSLPTFTLYLVVGLKANSSSLPYSFSPTVEQSETPLKEKKAFRKENLIPLEINLDNFKLDIEGIIKIIRGMIIELVNINSFGM